VGHEPTGSCGHFLRAAATNPDFNQNAIHLALCMSALLAVVRRFLLA
jgi:hypothetical protein